MLDRKNKKLKICGKILASLCIVYFSAYRYLAYKLDDFYTCGESTRFISFGNLIELLFAVLSLVMICGMLCYTVFNFEKFYACFSSITDKKGITIALYLAASFVLFLSPLDPALSGVKGFNRVFGAGYVVGEDVSRRIISFTIWIALFACSFALIFLFVNYLLHQETGKNKERNSALVFLRNFMVVANCCLIFRGVLFFQTETNQLAKVNDFTTKAVFLIVIVCLIYLIFHLNRIIQFDSYLRLHFIMFCLSFPVLIVSGMKWYEGNMLFGFWLLMTISVNGVLLIRNRKHQIENEKIKQRRFTATLVISALIPFITSAYIEMIHVLNQWNIFVGKPALGYSLCVCGLIFFGLLWDIISHYKSKGIQRPDSRSYVKWILAMFVFGMACLSTQIQLSSWYDFDLFEGANYGVLINDMLNYGEIPIIEHYGGHQMTNVWAGLLYGILNRDFASAYVVPYINLATVVMAVVFFFFIRELWEEKIAVLVALFIPYNHMWHYYGMGVIVLMTAVSFVRKDTWSRAFLFWLSCVWCVSYRLDLGFAFSASAAIAIGGYLIRIKNKDAGRKLLITLVIEGTTIAGLWIACCIIKQINPISRLKEFLALSFSNQNWAYQGVGNVGDMAFGWFYLFLPFAVVLGILVISFSGKIRDSLNHDKWVLALILGLAYLFNFSRGLVRHSWHEKQTVILAFTGYLFLSYAVSTWLRNKKLFLPAFVLLLIFNSLLVNGNNVSISAIAESAVSTPASIVESWTNTVYPSQDDSEKKISYWEFLQQNQQKVKRVMLTENKQNMAKAYSSLIDLLLEEDETFGDLTNVSTLYPLLNRESPFYIAQSPGMLSGEFTQEEFIREIKGVPLIIMPGIIDTTGLSVMLDGINNTYKYYKVAEYINQEYIPLCKYGEKFALWCLKEKKETYQLKLSRVISDGFEYKDKLLNNEKITAHRMNISQGNDGTIELTAIDYDPFITGLETFLDVRTLSGIEASIVVDYSTECPGMMEFLYTTEPGEIIDGHKAVSVFVSDSGTAEYQFPTTENTILRFDIPDGGVVKIHSLRMKLPIELIDYGYDGPFKEETIESGVTWQYNNAFHVYSLNQLPLYWGEYDNRKASKNPVLCGTEEQDGMYIFNIQNVNKTNGNYLKLHFSWDGYDAIGHMEEDDEFCDTVLVFGRKEEGTFEEKYRFDFNTKEGTHDYLIRCSADYYWYMDQANAIKIMSSEELYDMTVQILEGD